MVDSSKNGIVRISGDMHVYKQLLPLGKDILNNNKAPNKFIIKLISEEVDIFMNQWVWPTVRFQACVSRMSRCA